MYLFTTLSPNTASDASLCSQPLLSRVSLQLAPRLAPVARLPLHPPLPLPLPLQRRIRCLKPPLALATRCLSPRRLLMKGLVFPSRGDISWYDCFKPTGNYSISIHIVTRQQLLTFYRSRKEQGPASPAKEPGAPASQAPSKTVSDSVATETKPDVPTPAAEAPLDPKALFYQKFFVEVQPSYPESLNTSPREICRVYLQGLAFVLTRFVC